MKLNLVTGLGLGQPIQLVATNLKPSQQFSAAAIRGNRVLGHITRSVKSKTGTRELLWNSTRFMSDPTLNTIFRPGPHKLKLTMTIWSRYREEQ